MTHPVLTILIPTWNRAAFLSAQLERLLPMLGPHGEAVEILVGDNASTDPTAATARAFAGREPRVRVVTHPAHVPTAEENLLQTLAFARGTYVWPLADDDIPQAGSLASLLEVLDREAPGLLLMNQQIVDAQGKVLCPGYFETRAAYFTFNGMANLVRSLGIQDLPACFSAVCWRREDVLRVDWQAYSAVSPIYPHVMVYLEAFRDSPCVLMGQPMLSYLHIPYQDAASIGGVMDVSGRPTCFPWTLGIQRLLREAARRGAVPGEFLQDVVELVLRKGRWTVTPRPLAKSVVLYLTDQVRRCGRNPSPREWLTPADWREVGRDLAFSPVLQAFLQRLEALAADLERDWTAGRLVTADADARIDLLWTEVSGWPDRFDPVAPEDPCGIRLPGHLQGYRLRGVMAVQDLQDPSDVD